MGAYHSSDLHFVFDNPLGVLRASELPLAHTMVAYWQNFAVTGDPNAGPSAATGGVAPMAWPRLVNGSGSGSVGSGGGGSGCGSDIVGGSGGGGGGGGGATAGPLAGQHWQTSSDGGCSGHVHAALRNVQLNLTLSVMTDLLGAVCGFWDPLYARLFPGFPPASG